MRIAIALLLLTACQGNEQCTDWSGASGSASWSNCGDKKTRKVECDMSAWLNSRVGPGAPKSIECTCTVDGVVGKKFETTDPTKLGTMENATSIANEQCGWHVKR
jgi:hypothetical protein